MKYIGTLIIVLSIASIPAAFAKEARLGDSVLVISTGFQGVVTRIAEGKVSVFPHGQNFGVSNWVDKTDIAVNANCMSGICAGDFVAIPDYNYSQPQIVSIVYDNGMALVYPNKNTQFFSSDEVRLFDVKTLIKVAP